MNNRIWVIAAVVGSLATLALGWFLGVSPRVAEIAAADAERFSIETINTQTEADIAALKADFDNVDDYQSDLDALRVSIPDDSDLTSYIRQLAGSSVTYGVAVTSFSPAAEIAFTPVGADGAATAEASTNFFVVPVTVSVSGPINNILGFLYAMQGGDRLFLLTGFTYQSVSTTGADEFSATIDGFIYVLLGPNSGTITPTAPTAPNPVPTESATPVPTDTATTFPLNPGETPTP